MEPGSFLSWYTPTPVRLPDAEPRVTEEWDSGIIQQNKLTEVQVST